MATERVTKRTVTHSELRNWSSRHSADVVVETDIAQRFAIAVELRAGAHAVPQRIDENDERDEHASGQAEGRAGRDRALPPEAARGFAAAERCSLVIARLLQVVGHLYSSRVERRAAAGACLQRLVQLDAEELLDLRPIRRARTRQRAGIKLL